MLASVRTMIVIGLTAATGFAAGWFVSARFPAPGTSPPPPLPCAAVTATAPVAALTADAPATVDAVANQVSGAMPGDILAEVDDGNPAAVDMAFVQALIPLHEQEAMAARQMLEHGEDDELKGVAETVVRTRQGEIVWLRGWLDNHEEPENRTP